MNKVVTVPKWSRRFLLPLPSHLSMTGLTSLKIAIRRPDFTIIEKTLTTSDFVTGSHQVKILTDAEDINQTGIYDYQFFDITAGGVPIYIGTFMSTFYVDNTLKDVPIT